MTQRQFRSLQMVQLRLLLTIVRQPRRSTLILTIFQKMFVAV